MPANFEMTDEVIFGRLEMQYTYTNASGKVVTGSKTVYDPAVYIDQAILNMAQNAGQRGYALYLKDTSQRIFDVSQNGVNFRVYVNTDPKTGPSFVGNVHIQLSE